MGVTLGDELERFIEILQEETTFNNSPDKRGNQIESLKSSAMNKIIVEDLNPEEARMETCPEKFKESID